MADIEIRCSVCDATLEGDFKKYGEYSAAIIVEPCKDCLAEEHQKGYDHGKEDGESGD